MIQINRNGNGLSKYLSWWLWNLMVNKEFKNGLYWLEHEWNVMETQTSGHGEIHGERLIFVLVLFLSHFRHLTCISPGSIETSYFPTLRLQKEPQVWMSFWAQIRLQFPFPRVKWHDCSLETAGTYVHAQKRLKNMDLPFTHFRRIRFKWLLRKTTYSSTGKIALFPKKRIEIKIIQAGSSCSFLRYLHRAFLISQLHFCNVFQ